MVDAMWLDFLRAVALVLVIEGLAPFLAPVRFRATLVRLLSFNDHALRTIGLACMIIGLIALQGIRWLV